MESLRPQGVRESEIRRSQAWVEWDGQSPIEGEGLFPGQRGSKRTGKKKKKKKNRGGSRCQWEKARVQDSWPPARQKVSKQETRARAGSDQPQCPESLHFPQETRLL